MFKFIFKGLLDFVKFTDIFHFIHLPLSEANFGLVFKFVFKDLLALFKFTERVFIHFPILGINFGLTFIFKGLLESSGSMTYSFAHQFQLILYVQVQLSCFRGRDPGLALDANVFSHESHWYVFSFTLCFHD